MKIKYKRPPLSDYQSKILDAPERFTITEASTKSGKTASHVIWLLEQALKGKDNQNFWWISPTYSQAEIAFNRMRTQVNRELFRVNLSKLTLTLPTGAIIQFKTAQDADNLYGEDVYAAVFDEATRAKEDAWFALRSTLTATRAKCKIIGNAKGKKNWVYKLGVKARAGAKDYKYFKITAYDAVAAGILDLEEVEQAKKDLPEHVFKELYLAEPSEDGSNPFGLSYMQAVRQTVLSLEPPEFFGIDIAKSYDWTCIIGLDKKGRVAYFDRFQKDWAQTKSEILKLPNKPILIDSTGVGDSFCEDLFYSKPSTQGFKFTSDSKQKLISGLSVGIQSGECGILAGIMFEEMESFEFVYNASTGNVRYSAPSGLNDDTVCALGLAFKCYKDNLSKSDFWKNWI